MIQTQKEQLLQMFAENNNQLTLGQILKTNLASAYRPRLSDLREDGYVIDCILNKEEPSKNLYVLKSKAQAKGELVQVSWPCPICGSYYRRGSDCNICPKENA